MAYPNSPVNKLVLISPGVPFSQGTDPCLHPVYVVITLRKVFAPVISPDPVAFAHVTVVLAALLSWVSPLLSVKVTGKLPLAGLNSGAEADAEAAVTPKIHSAAAVIAHLLYIMYSPFVVPFRRGRLSTLQSADPHSKCVTRSL